MNDDVLKQLWREQKIKLPPRLPDTEQIASVRRGMKRFDRTIFWRNFREVLACIFSVIWFTLELFHGHSLMTQAGCWVLILSSIFIGSNLVISKRRVPAADSAASIEESIRTEIRKVDVQIRLLKSVFWWYLLPITLGANLYFTGRNPALRAEAGYLIFTIVLAVFLWWLNLRAVKRKLLPMKAELESLLGLPPKVKTMKTNPITIMLLLIIFICICATPLLWAAIQNGPINSPPLSGEAATLDRLRKKYNLPALAVVVVKAGKICDREAVGVRKCDDSTPITTNDVFHIGSCTKSMTATLAAMFIEEGKLRWNTTIADVFPELRGKMNQHYETVTVEQLLTQRSGIPAEPPAAAWAQAWKEIGTPVAQRYAFISAVLAAPPATATGKKFIYSNQNYAIVGAMLEKIAGRPWEDLITEKLFKPLHMDSAGFGPPGTEGKIDQPWGHTRKFLITLPVQLDNPPAIAPAGRVHCSLDDLANYAIFQMEGERIGGLLKPETFRKLHTPPSGGDYACGWVCTERDWAGGRVLWHNGSNTMWYLVMWLAPEKDSAVIVATNIAGTDAEKACDEAARAMIDQWLAK